jgi:hypothetical protein
MDTVCFWLDPTNRVRRHLRRYVGDQERPPDDRRCLVAEQGYHQAWVRIEDADAVWIEPGGTVGGLKTLKTDDAADLKSDMRWPMACSCGQKFREDDAWQVVTDLIYRRADSGETMTLRDAPPGALWDAWWLRGKSIGSREYGGPDGRVITVKTPAGAWVVDGPSIDHPAQTWARTGEPPKITVRPSIRIGSPVRYYAFLTNGVLRAFPLTANEAQLAAANASSETGVSLSVVQVRTGAFVVMETSVAMRHHLKVVAAYAGHRGGRDDMM